MAWLVAVFSWPPSEFDRLNLSEMRMFRAMAEEVGKNRGHK
jgi:hypothetical protein